MLLLLCTLPSSCWKNPKQLGADRYLRGELRFSTDVRNQGANLNVRKKQKITTDFENGRKRGQKLTYRRYCTRKKVERGKKKTVKKEN